MQKNVCFRWLPPFELADKIEKCILETQLKDQPNIALGISLDNGSSFSMNSNTLAGIFASPEYQFFKKDLSNLPKSFGINDYKILLHSNQWFNAEVLENGRGYTLIRQGGPQGAATFINALANTLTFVSKFELAHEGLPEIERSLLEARAKDSEDLRDASQEVLGAVGKGLESWHQEITKITKDLQDANRKKEDELEVKFQKKEDELVARQKDFEAKVAQFNDHGRTHVRRDLLDQIRKKIKELSETKLSDSTNKKSGPVRNLFGLLVFLGCAGIAMFSIPIVNSLITGKFPDYLWLIPFSSSVLFTSAAVVFALRWHDQWLKMHAEAEMANKRFEEDILRASWLAEMYFEWDETKKAEFPKQMAESFTRGLFVPVVSNVKTAEHPIEDVIRFADKFEEFKIGRDGVEARKGKKSNLQGE